jgi:hypothetical protein
MRATRIKIESLIVKIAQTREIEATCDDCARLSAKLAEVLLASRVEDEQLLAILHHLQECIPCAEEFQVLRDCARMEHEGSWPSLEEIWQKLDGAP